MKVAGYVRQTPGHTDPDTAFAQQERIRRWARDTGNELVACCEDAQDATASGDRSGFKALLRLARNNDADAVVVASLTALSPDKIIQEIMLHDLREAGATIIATDPADVELLAAASNDHARILVHDIVAKLHEYRETFELSGESIVDLSDEETAPAPMAVRPTTTDVVVELTATR